MYAVPATGTGVECEFSLAGNIVNRRRNRLSPKTISDLMQYKRWVARHGIIAKITVDQIDDEIDDDVVESDDDTVEELVDWLGTWKQNKTLKKRAEALAEL
jgi:hypothetical protein